jgi:hypothetical protein
MDHSPEVEFSSEFLSIIFKSSQQRCGPVPLEILTTSFWPVRLIERYPLNQSAAAPVCYLLKYAVQILFRQYLRTVRSSDPPRDTF